MPKDEYAQRPSAPDLGAVLDETPEYTMVGADAGDLLDAGYVPPDRPYVLNDDEVTARGMWEGETLDQRLAQELPDTTLPSDAESDRAGRLAADDSAPDTWSATSLDAVDVESREAQPRPRRLPSTYCPLKRWARHLTTSPMSLMTTTCATMRLESTTAPRRTWSSDPRRTSGSGALPPAMISTTCGGQGADHSGISG